MKKSDYVFACDNGYKGSEEGYIALQYKGYTEICKRCGIDPMPKTEYDRKSFEF